MSDRSSAIGKRAPMLTTSYAKNYSPTYAASRSIGELSIAIFITDVAAVNTDRASIRPAGSQHRLKRLPRWSVCEQRSNCFGEHPHEGCLRNLHSASQSTRSAWQVNTSHARSCFACSRRVVRSLARETTGPAEHTSNSPMKAIHCRHLRSALDELAGPLIGHGHALDASLRCSKLASASSVTVSSKREKERPQAIGWYWRSQSPP